MSKKKCFFKNGIKEGFLSESGSSGLQGCCWGSPPTKHFVQTPETNHYSCVKGALQPFYLYKYYHRRYIVFFQIFQARDPKSVSHLVQESLQWSMVSKAAARCSKEEHGGGVWIQRKQKIIYHFSTCCFSWVTGPGADCWGSERLLLDQRPESCWVPTLSRSSENNGGFESGYYLETRCDFFMTGWTMTTLKLVHTEHHWWINNIQHSTVARDLRWEEMSRRQV